ncbi:MAG: phage terminase small subunit P27 family [bacterium]|nr:phage terminase small subunit P27 family [bacterium]
MKPGPKPLPSNVHLLRGNPSKKTADRLMDSVAPEVELPVAPEHLLPAAVLEWERIGAELVALGLVSLIDRAALALYCQAWARWVEAETKLRELGEEGLTDVTPNGFRQMGVWLQISNRAADQVHKYLCEFGMSPSSRSRVTPSPQMDLFENGDDSGSSAASAKDPGRFFT